MRNDAVRIEPTLLPKAGDDAADCEDVFCIASELTTRNLRAAVADGATAGSYSGVLAELLVEAFVEKPFFDYQDLSKHLEELSVRWSANVYSRDLPWYALERAKRGAFSTIVGIELSGDETPRWRAVALGDSAIFVFREGQIVDSLPFLSSRDFPIEPTLISTVMERNDGLAAHLHTMGGEVKRGDIVFLASDALAKMLFQSVEHGEPPIAEIIQNFEQPECIEAAVEGYRARGFLQNDDVAAIVIRIL